MNPSETVVVGAGLAGLTAAVHLAQRGVPVLVLEADALNPGGRLWGGPPSAASRVHLDDDSAASSTVTLTQNGMTWSFPAEHGLHGLWNEYHNLRATLERFHVTPDVLLAQEEEWIHGEVGRVRRVEIGSAIRNAWLPAPLHYLELFTRPGFLGMLSPREWLALPRVWYGLLFALALDPFIRLIPLEGQSLQDFFQGWSPRVKALFVGLARSALGARPHEISLATFVAFLRFYTLLRRDAWRFSYLTTDPGTALIEPLVERLRSRGGTALLGATADRLTPQPDHRGWEVRFHTLEGVRRFAADHVILAVDAPAARRLLCESPATRAAAQALHWPEGLANAVVRVWLDCGPRPGPEAGIFTGDFVMDNFFWLHRIQPAFAAWASATGGSAVEMHIYGPDDFLAQPEAVILARVITDLYRAFPDLRGHARRQILQRNAATHSRLLVDRPERWLGVQTSWPRLWACGDWVRGPWPALHLERACVSGLTAANHVLQALDLEPFPVMPYSAPEWLAARLQSWLLGGRAWVRRWRRAAP